ncbi:hypothetical protein TNCV_885331 [Trichonephila clavipes]|nr:hypothetical protein TNCV_885331 [Trichonephila clavipes]
MLCRILFYGFNVLKHESILGVLDLGKEEKNQEGTYPVRREDVLLGLFCVLSGTSAQDWRCALGLRHDEASDEKTPTTPVVFSEQPLLISSWRSSRIRCSLSGPGEHTHDEQFHVHRKTQST